MHPKFAQLFPFVFAGILIGTFFPLESRRTLGRTIRPSSTTSASDKTNISSGGVSTTNRSGLHQLLVRYIASLWNTISVFNGPSTTLTHGNSQFSHPSAGIANSRMKLLSAARAHGWIGLEKASSDSLSMIGISRGPDNSLTSQIKSSSYIRRYLTYSFFDILSRNEVAALSPGVLNNIVGTLVATGHTSSLPEIKDTLQLDECDVGFILSSMMAIGDLVIALIPQVENEPNIRAAFTHFAEDPTSWGRFNSAVGANFSVEEIVRHTHQLSSRGPSFRILTLGLPRPGSRSEGLPTFLPYTILAALDAIFGSMRLTVADIPETRNVTLRDEEIEYLAALFIAAFMRWHARSVKFE